MCQAYEAEARLVTIMEDALLRKKIFQEGVGAGLQGKLAKDNPRHDAFDTRKGYVKAWLDGLQEGYSQQMEFIK